MIRNKRTTFAACVETANPLGIRSTVPRLAGPIVDDTAAQFRFPTNTPDSIRRRTALPNGNPFRTPPR
jgi:hypothetical protein